MTLHILKADTPGKEILDVAGDYEAMYTRIIRGAGFTGTIQAWDVVHAMEYPVVEPGDVCLISGSVKDAWRDEEWILKLLEWTKHQLSAQNRLIGVCFGHQIIARALGARVGQAEWELGVVPLDLTPDGINVLGPYIGTHPSIIQSHRDQVFDVPKGSTLLAATTKGPVQIFYRPHAYLCIQGHPEFTDKVIFIICSGYARGTPEDIATTRNAHNGLDYARAMTAFIAGDI